LAARLRAGLPRQRGFAGKGMAIAEVSVVDATTLGDGAGWLLVEVTAEGAAAPARYQMLVATQTGEADLNGAAHEAVRAWWFKLLATSAALPTAAGQLEFEALAPGLEAASSRVSGAEQSNTSMLYGDGASEARYVFKLFRRLMAGENPEFEIPRALAEHTHFRRVPRALGRVLYKAGAEAYTLATLQEFIPNRGDGWEYELRQLRAGAALQADIALLGRRTAELHLALSAIAAPGFSAQPVTADDVERWRQRAIAGATEPRLSSYQELLAPWRARLADARASGLAGLTGRAQVRIHGDYHLGQVLKTKDDFIIFDFEGEPSRPLDERRRRGCVLQDAAGMLRSLDYAAHTVGVPAWLPEARKAFLNSYFDAMGTAPLVPADAPARAAALRFFETEKAVYELNYELANRPDWVRVPLAGLSRLLTS
jgi:trehalose synthase-fused probable maltokinase